MNLGVVASAFWAVLCVVVLQIGHGAITLPVLFSFVFFLCGLPAAFSIANWQEFADTTIPMPLVVCVVATLCGSTASAIGGQVLVWTEIWTPELQVLASLLGGLVFAAVAESRGRTETLPVVRQ